MAKKKDVQTFHPLAMAKSLEAQNETIGILIAEVSSMANFADKADAALLRDLAKKCGERAEAARKVLWPENNED